VNALPIINSVVLNAHAMVAAMDVIMMVRD
jgi:hypothetical protein